MSDASSPSRADAAPESARLLDGGEVRLQMRLFRPQADVGVVAALAELAPEGGIETQGVHGVDQLGDSAIGKTASALVDDFGHGSEVVRDHGCAPGKGLERNEAEGLVGQRGNQESDRTA